MALPAEAEGALSRSPTSDLPATSVLSVERCVLVFIILTAAGMGFAGIKKNLPFTPEVDEGFFVGPAVDIAATGDLNPGWFGHFFLDFDTARADIRAENRQSHLGADGLSKPGNLSWYIREAIPGAVTLPVALLALMGAGLALLARRSAHLLLIAMLGIFLVGISYSSASLAALAHPAAAYHRHSCSLCSVPRRILRARPL